MKKILLGLSALIIGITAHAQTDVELVIQHQLGNTPFQMNSTTQNNLAQDYQVTRLQYYVTRITVLHDGNQSLAIHDDTMALVNATDGLATTIQLGSLNVTNIEGVKFHIGVYSPVNNDDPLNWPATHPLAPQNPSMHWGWATGYRFLVYEGKGGANFSQVFQLHGLGNQNYFETTVVASAFDVNGTKVIGVNADYARGVEDIHVGNGVISHGEIGEAKKAIENFSNYVFSASSSLVSVTEENTVAWDVYPNPSSSEQAITVTLPSNIGSAELVVSNLMGQVIQRTQNTNQNTMQLDIEDAGIYFVTLLADGVVIDTKRLVKH